MSQCCQVKKITVDFLINRYKTGKKLSVIHLYCLHGLLGHPSEWEFLNALPEIKICAVDLYSQFDPEQGLLNFADRLNQSLDPNQVNILLGYSMGGRLGLHAVLARPDLWKGALFVSAHPGLERQEEIEKRIAGDEFWAESFLTEDWKSLMARWNGQSVFTGSGQIERCETTLKRDLLAAAFRGWGLGQQGNLRLLLGQASIPICWISGQEDTKFCLQSKSLKFKHANSSKVEIAQAGHRVPWDHPQAFKKTLKGFLYHCH